MPAVLLIDDDPDVQALVAAALRGDGIEVAAAMSAHTAHGLLARDRYAAILLDLGLPDAVGEELLASLRQEHPRTPVLVLSAAGEVARVVQCMRLGAVDFVGKPFEALRLRTSVHNAIQQGKLRQKVEDLANVRQRREGLGNLLGRSACMRAVADLLARGARSDATVLLTGESGTGKEVAARAVHAESARREGPFLAINCGAIPEGVIESELFGHEKGAFTGALTARRGCFEEAEGGTLFLDEIGELRPDLQVRLLRVLQERQVQRVGGARPVPIDVRIVAATNRELTGAMATFRQDLYYRLAVFPVHLPPLRDRGEDVLLLAQAFVQRAAERHGGRLQGMSRSFAAALLAHDWPGNVRELENTIERAVLLEDGPLLQVASLPLSLQSLGAPSPGVVDTVAWSVAAAAVAPALAETARLPQSQAERSEPAAEGTAASPAPNLPLAPLTPADVEPFDLQERRIIENALAACAWNIREAARRLGIGRATIYRKMERYGLDRMGDHGAQDFLGDEP